MNSIQSWMTKPAGQVSGIFRMRKPVVSDTKAGQPYLRIWLEDVSGSLCAYAWRKEIYENLNFQDLSCVYVEGQIRQRSDATLVDLLAINTNQLQKRAGAVRLIPQSLCPVPWLMSVLDAAVSRLTSEPLAQFVESVLADDSIAFPFVSAPASLNHHHNYPGGLLAHSLECYQMVGKHSEFRRQSLELGLVAALFYDIGKILTITHEMKRTSLGYNLDHDKLTLEILGPYLRQLDQQWPDGANELRYLLTWKKGQKVPKHDMADLVSCCDRLSAGMGLQKRT